MARHHFAKIGCIVLLVVSGVGMLGAGADIQAADTEAWVNDDAGEYTEVSGTCSQGYSPNSFHLNTTDADAGNVTVSADENLTTEALRNRLDTGNNTTLGLAAYTVKLSCHNASNRSQVVFSDSVTLELNTLSITTNEAGTGFVGERLRASDTNGLSFLEAATITLSTDAAGTVNITADGLEPRNIKARGGDVTLDDRFTAEQEADGVRLTLTPYITDWFSEDEGLTVQYRRNGNTVGEVTLPTTIYTWKARPVSNTRPVKRLAYDSLEDEYVYGIDTTYKGEEPGDAGTLLDENFRLTVYEREDEDSESFDEVVSDTYDNKDWLSAEIAPDASYDYRVSIDNFNRLAELAAGQYRFELAFQKDVDGETVTYPIDDIYVDKGSGFTGRVTSSGGNGVPSKITLTKNGVQTKVISVASDGFYDEQIEYDVYDSMRVNLGTGGEAPNAVLTVNRPDLTIRGETGADHGSIVFDYWKNPSNAVSIAGIDPVAMMAVGFGYDITGGAQTMMQYSAADIRPNDVRVYECDEWNFGSEECFGDWDAVDATVDPTRVKTWMAYIDDLSLFSIDQSIAYDGRQKDILRNAYVVGVPSQLQLTGNPPITLNQQEVAANENIQVAGTVQSTNGDQVENAAVTVRLSKDGEEVAAYEATTDVSGSFTVEGAAPDKKGTYRIDISVDKDPYEPLVEEGVGTMTVFYDSDVSIRAPDQPQITMGEESSLDLTLVNTGQTRLTDISVAVSGIGDDRYSLGTVPSSLASGESTTVPLSLSIPDGYCELPCTEPPQLLFDMTATGPGGAEVSSQTRMLTSFPYTPDQTNASSSTSEATVDDDEAGPQRSSSSVTESVIGPVGNIVRTQSDMNIALTLILLFAIVLAVAVKRRSSSDDRDGRTPREQVVKTPMVSANNGSSTSGKGPQQSRDASSSEKGADSDPDEGDTGIVETDAGTYRYDGKEFDTVDAVELYKELQET